MNQMKLQKLVYMAHGWNLAVNKEPLVAQSFEAWDGGPVLRKVWNHIRDFGYNLEGKFFASPDGEKHSAELTDRERAVVEHVWKRYGDYSGIELSDMTHQPGTPWSNAYFGSGRNSRLPQTDIQSHFIELALAGRARTAA